MPSDPVVADAARAPTPAPPVPARTSAVEDDTGWAALIGLPTTTEFFDRRTAGWFSATVLATGVLTATMMAFDTTLGLGPWAFVWEGAWVVVNLVMLHRLARRPRAGPLLGAMIGQALLVVMQFHGHTMVTGVFALSNVLIGCLLAWPVAAVLSVSLMGAIAVVVTVDVSPALFSPLWLPQPAIFGFTVGWALRRSFIARGRAEELAQRLRATNEVLGEHLRSAHELATARERTRIAQELHDRLGHCLTTMHLYLEVAQRGVTGATSEATLALDKACTTNKEALGELRSCVSLLRDPEVDRSLSDAMRELLQRFPSSIITTHLSILGPERRLDPMQEFALFRALQEALTNVAQHSGAHRVDVSLRYSDQSADRSVELTVSDDGVGGEPATQGVGLTGIRERLESVGGQLRLESQPGAGFRLVATLA